MQFAQPLWLLAGLAACALLFWRYRQFENQQRKTLARFASTRLLDKLTASVSPARRRAKQVFFTLGVFCLFVALARPQAGYEWQETHRKGLELLFAVDTSKSMLAQDVKPDRLSRAKLAVHDLVDKLDGDAVGLVAFAGNAFLQCPVTLDYDAFRESLDALDTKVIPRGGTDIAAAIREAEAVFKTRTAAEKILVLITDGEDLGGEGIAAAKEAAKNGVKIFAVGIGSTTGDLVPIPNENGGTDFVRGASGQLVKSHLDEATLKQIVGAAGGMYEPLGQQGEGLKEIYNQGLASFTRHDLSSRQAKVPLEQFHWPLLAALGCFIAEMLIGTRRKVREAKSTPAPSRAKPAWAHRPATTAAAALAIALLGVTATTRGALSQTAEQAYQQGDFAKSQKEYTAAAVKEPTKTELQFNAGSAAYKAGDLAQAATAFQNSLHTEQVPVQQGAYYNLGNTQFRLGQKSEKSNPKETIETWEKAVSSYDAALQIEPGDQQAKHNRDLVKQKVEQLKKQEDQKKQQQQDQKNDSKDQKSDSKNQQAGQGPQEPKDQKQPDQKSDPKNQQAGQNGQEPKDQKQPDQKSDPKNQQAGQNGQQPKDQKQPDQKNDPKNQQAGQNGQQPKDQKQPDQKNDPKNQQAGQNGQEPKDQKQVDQKNDPRNQQAGQNGQEPKDQKQQDQAQNGRPDPTKTEPPNPTGKKPSRAQPEAADGQRPEPGESVSAGSERREPGQMTKEEAQQLLDALKNDEHKLPAASMRGRTAGQPDDQQPPIKDW
jgi:Ca-activated chloride channel family protein